MVNDLCGYLLGGPLEDGLVAPHPGSMTIRDYPMYGNPWFSVQAVLAVHQGRQPPVTHRRLVRRPCRRCSDDVLKVVYAGQGVGNLASDLRPGQDVTATRPRACHTGLKGARSASRWLSSRPDDTGTASPI